VANQLDTDLRNLQFSTILAVYGAAYVDMTLHIVVVLENCSDFPGDLKRFF
jgi:hypothetical protein